MKRILHLLPVDAEFQTARSTSLLARQIGSDFEIASATIGRGGSFRDWLHAGLSLRRRATGTFDLIHAFGGSATSAAVLSNSAAVIHTPITFPTRALVRWLNASAAHARLHVVCSTSTESRALVSRGFPMDRCHVIRPAVELARLQRRRDAHLRKQLGLDDNDFVILAAGESTRSANHEAGVFMAGILGKLNPQYRLLLWGRGDDASRVAKVARRLEEQTTVRFAETILGKSVEYETLFTAADAVLVPAGDPVPTLPICIAMASALPIVAVASRTNSELLEDRHTALMVPAAQSRVMAQRVLDLRADSRLQWSISDMARTESFEYFSPSRFLSQFRSVYEQVIAGKDVVIPAQQAGAGLRFHGRA